MNKIKNVFIEVKARIRYTQDVWEFVGYMNEAKFELAEARKNGASRADIRFLEEIVADYEERLPYVLGDID